MRHFFSFFATREDETLKKPKLQPRKFVQAVRSALVNVSGITYPNMQSSINWSDFHHDERSLVFNFDRRVPYGDCRFEEDHSYASTRRLTEDEEGPIIFLEALTFELVCNMIFFDHFIRGMKASGTFRIGLSIGGFENAHMDWSGFNEDAQRQGTLVNWRFKPTGTIATFEEGEVSFPAGKKEDQANLDEKIAQLVAEASFLVVGVRHSPLRPRHDEHLMLDINSIRSVVAQARSAAAE